MVEKKSDKKKLTIKKDSVKDLAIQPGKAKDVKGGGGVSKPRTPCDPGCTPC